MKTTFKLLAAALLCVGICGCGGSDGNGPNYDAPMVANGAIAAVGVDIDGFMTSVKETVRDFAGKDADEILSKMSLSNPDLPEEIRSFLENSGLGKADFEWVVVSVGMPHFKDPSRGKIREPDSVPDIAVVVRVNHDFDRFCEALDGSMDESDRKSMRMEGRKIAGERALGFKMLKERNAKELEELGLEPVIGTISGKLLVYATTPRVFGDQVALYRDGKGASREISGIKSNSFYLKVVKLDTILRELVMVDIDNPKERDRLIREIGDTSAQPLLEAVAELSSVGICYDGKVTDVEIGMLSDDGAQKMQGLLHLALMMGKMALSKSAELKSNENISKFVKSIKITASGNVVNVEMASNAFGLGGALAASLFPAISQAITSANTSAKSINGMKLHRAMTTASLERGAVGMPPLWPATPDNPGDDISEMDFSTAEEYFNELFDIGNRGESNWNPYVADFDMEGLWGSGVKAPDPGRKLGRDNVGWSIAKNMPEEAPDFMPLLVSSNVNCEELLSAYSVRSNDHIHTKDGKPAIIVTKGGKVTAYQPKDFTYSRVYPSTFRAIDGRSAHKLTYLVPGGEVRPTTR